MNGMKFYLVEAFPQLASPAVVLDRILPLIRQSRIAGLRSKYPQVVKVMRLPVADFMQARVRLGVRRHIKVCEASIASVAGVDRGGSGGGSATAMDGKLRRSFLSDRLELRLLLVAQRSIEAFERGAHQTDRSLHGFKPPLHGVKASGWCDRVFRLASSVQDVDSPGIGVLQRFKSGALSVVRVQPGLDLVRRPLQ